MFALAFFSDKSGHDEDVTYAEMERRVVFAHELKRMTLQLYRQAAEYAEARGVIVADTKFEFGILRSAPPGHRIIVIDEMLTPDSSRFWPADRYAPGTGPPSFDKQFVRDWLGRQSWDRTPPAPPLPPDVVEGTRKRYVEAYETLTGRSWRD